MKLRQGVKFHDGTPFTAKDVKATFDRVLDPAKKMIARGNHAKIKTVEIVDDYTVRFKTDGPYPLFVERLTAQVMESEKVIREKGDEWMQEHPVGTGPYKLVSWQRKQEHLLVRNDDYWGPKPYYKYVRIRIIPEQATQIAELLSGGVDIMKAVPPDQMDVINKSGAARTATSPILRTAFLQLDQAARGGPNPFTDKRVRSGGEPGRRQRRHHQARPQRPRRPRRHRRQPDGLRLGPDPQAVQAGHRRAPRSSWRRPATPTAWTSSSTRGLPPSSPALQQTNDAIVSDMTKAGFRVKRNYIGDNTVVVARAKEGKLGPMFNWSWGYYSVFDADAILYDIFKCGEFYSYYCNKELDDLIISGTLDPRPEEADRGLRQGPEAALRRGGLSLQVGPPRRLGHLEPRRLLGAARRGRPDVPRDSPEEVAAVNRLGGRGA